MIYFQGPIRLELVSEPVLDFEFTLGLKTQWEVCNYKIIICGTDAETGLQAKQTLYHTASTITAPISPELIHDKFQQIKLGIGFLDHITQQLDLPFNYNIFNCNILDWAFHGSIFAALHRCIFKVENDNIAIYDTNSLRGSNSPINIKLSDPELVPKTIQTIHEICRRT